MPPHRPDSPRLRTREGRSPRRRLSALALTLALATLAPGAGASSLEGGLDAYRARDYRTALSVLEPWAQAGEPEAQLVLGRMYAGGEGVPQDYVTAHKWLNLAASGGLERARAEREGLTARMTAGQIADAQAAARAWRPGPRPPETGSVPGATTPRSLPAGNLTARVQAMLADLGYDPGPADGTVGAKTRAAIRSYQSHSGLPQTGEVTVALHDSLAADLGIAGPRSSAAGGQAVLESARGSSTETSGTVPDRGDAALRSAMAELTGIADDAERRRSAAPTVIAQLRELVARHAASQLEAVAPRTAHPSQDRLRVVLETFADGDFDRNPRWTVRSGRFWIDERSRLRTDVAAAPAGPLTKEEIPLAILGAILGQGGGSRGATGERALIDLEGDLPEAFEVHLGFSAAPGPGALQLELLSPRGPGHHRSVRIAFSATALAVELVGADERVLASTSLRAGDGTVARELGWRRDEDGRISVWLEGEPVLAPAAPVEPERFAAFRLTNLAGSYAVHRLEIADIGGPGRP